MRHGIPDGIPHRTKNKKPQVNQSLGVMYWRRGWQSNPRFMFFHEVAKTHKLPNKNNRLWISLFHVVSDDIPQSRVFSVYFSV